MKSIIAGSLVALTLAATVVTPVTPASAIGIHIGPRGVGVGIGRGRFHRGYRRPFVHRRYYRGRHFFRRHF